jgi:hypothetical protein
MRMAWGAEWTGSEWVRCTELRLWLGMLLLPPGLANHRFCMGHGRESSMSGKRPRPGGGGAGKGAPSLFKTGPRAETQPHILGTATPTPEGSCLQWAHLSALAPQAGASEGMSRGDAPNA